MPKKRVVRKKKSMMDVPSVVRDYLLNRSMRERSDHQEKTIRGQMMEWMRERDSDIELDEPVPFVSFKGGKPVEREILGMKRTIRRSKSLNPDRAEAFLRKKNIFDECVETVVTLDESAIIRQNFEGNITDEELAALYDEREIEALELWD